MRPHFFFIIKAWATRFGTKRVDFMLTTAPRIIIHRIHGLFILPVFPKTAGLHNIIYVTAK